MQVAPYGYCPLILKFHRYFVILKEDLSHLTLIYIVLCSLKWRITHQELYYQSTCSHSTQMYTITITHHINSDSLLKVCECFSYHQKVPEALPDLDVKASYGLVTAEEFKLPQPNVLWTPESYKCFNIAANVGDPETVNIYVHVINILSITFLLSPSRLMDQPIHRPYM